MLLPSKVSVGNDMNEKMINKMTDINAKTVAFHTLSKISKSLLKTKVKTIKISKIKI
jgi:DNA-binding Xre family transcriptional regulator